MYEGVTKVAVLGTGTIGASWAAYFLAREALYAANFFMKQIDAVEIPLDVPFNFPVVMQLNLAILAEVKKLVLEARESKETKQALITQLLF